MDNQEWRNFVDQMRRRYKQAYEVYSQTLELNETDNAPPRMASYGSSALMIYLLSRDVEGFAFEKALPTTISRSPAKLDGYLERTNTYVEAKCHEPYSKQKDDVREAYRPLYAKLSEKTKLKVEDRGGKWYFSYNGVEINYFDIKQVICHLLGIGNAVLNKKTKAKARLLYLLYSPNGLMLCGDEKEIYNVFDKVLQESQMDYGEIYGAIIDFLVDKGIKNKTELSLEEIKNSFSFEMSCQNNYLEKLNGN